MVELNLIPLRKSINKAYLKVKPVREDFDNFKKQLSILLSLINDEESEEHNKNFIRDFLNNTFYGDKYVNTRERTDLAIHLDKTNKSRVGVIIEVKSPVNKYELITADNLNCKSMHEVILYYLRERIDKSNDEIKSIIITNAYLWFIFKADQFEKCFYKSQLKDEYVKWRNDKKVSNLNDHFYNEIIKKFLKDSDIEIEGVSFDLRDFRNCLDKDNEKKLIPLFKKFSLPELIKEPFANDSNNLNKQFYSELLHIIGLEEYKEKSKKKIRRKEENERDAGSLIENTIRMLKTKDVLKNFDDLSIYGETEEEQYYNIALELSIIWINRVLFLKLLEAQLVNYHKKNNDYKFLNPEIIHQYDDLFELFHQVLAIKPEERNKDLIQKFKSIPYLNSSLFELNDTEKKTINIAELKDRLTLPFYRSTVFRKELQSGELNALEYLLRFLDAYDFASEGGEDIIEERKTIINASVLGLIFEKINGYKEGSFYTPGFITMYMARETLRRAVVQKFNEYKKTEYKDYEELKRNIDTSAVGRSETNKIINELKICDPAVGSGHFLVSCLNEIIFIKADLNVLSYRDGRQVQNYSLEIENDELIITNEETDELFDYHLNDNDKPVTTLQDIQETLFHEKETIIENCLFGVDINPNSVNICRLRLWIELLKNSYYTRDSNYKELETLPNIDINIKQGNSLISRFKLDADLKKALKTFRYTIEDYKSFVNGYRTTKNKEEKRNYLTFIEDIKRNFRSEISINDPRRKKLNNLAYELHNKYETERLIDIELSEQAKKKLKTEENKLKKEIEKRTKELEAEDNGELFINAFEWRFEFPEVLDEEGNFEGFDVVIGNPPYIFGGNEGITTAEKKYFKEIYFSGRGKINLFTLFIERATSIFIKKGLTCLIIPNTFLRVTSYYYTRKFLLDNYKLQQVADFGERVFDDAITTSIVILSINENRSTDDDTIIRLGPITKTIIKQNSFINRDYVITLNVDYEKEKIINKLSRSTVLLGDIAKEIIFGVVITKNQSEIVSNKKIEGWKPFLEGRDIGSYYIKPINKYLNYDPKLLHRPRTKEIFESSEKLMIQRITGGNQPLKATYDNKQLYNKESINNIILTDNCGYLIKYVLAIINSKLMNWFYVNRFTNESRLTVNLSKEYLSQIPIKKTNSQNQLRIIELVDNILYIKDKGGSEDSSSQEKEIDQMVYKLYGLTEEEIRIVEAGKE